MRAGVLIGVVTISSLRPCDDDGVKALVAGVCHVGGDSNGGGLWWLGVRVLAISAAASKGVVVEKGTGP